MSKAFFDALDRLRWRSMPDRAKLEAVVAKIEATIRADERAQIVTMIKAQHNTTVDEIVRYLELGWEP